MTMPIFFLLIANFLGIMVEVRSRAEISAATSLAAQSSISAPVADTQHSCEFAVESYYDTLFNSSSVSAPPVGLCPNSNATSFSVNVTRPSGNPLVPVGPLFCDSSQASVPPQLQVLGTNNGTANYFTGNNYPVSLATGIGPPVTCTATVKVDFSSTPLAFGVFFTPQFTVTSIAIPTPVRQCATPTACG